MKFKNYSDYLITEHWLNFREEALRSASYQCEECGYDENLNIHHLTYENLGNESLNDIIVLCYRCHMEIHEAINNYYFQIENKKNRLADYYKRLGQSINLFFGKFGIDEDEECLMACNNCGTTSIIPASWHGAKLGCKCNDNHQRWEIIPNQHMTKNMMELELDDEIFEILNKLAQQDHVSPEELVKIILFKYQEELQTLNLPSQR